MLDSNASPYDRLRILMDGCGATVTPKEFYWAVNEAFHSAEALVYDQAHAGMFSGSAPMWRRQLGHLPAAPARLEALDVGSGTGLVGGFLAEFVPDRIARLTLLDPNGVMLERASRKAATWPFPIVTVQGDIDVVAGRGFDLITVSSVMHHVVEIEPFCAALAGLLRPGGLLLQMQDPPAAAASDPVLVERRRRAEQAVRRPRSALALARSLAGGVLRLLGRRPRNPLAEATNAPLLRTGVILRPLDMRTIWAVTDFHVPDQPGHLGQGLSVKDLSAWLTGLELIDTFTYEFFGVAAPVLGPAERSEDAALWIAGDPHGAQFGSAWKRG